jgi:phosphomannomutase/phosphoglucomutase
VIDEVISALNLQAQVLFGEPDGAFPNRTPDISGPEDLAILQAEVKQRGAPLGFGFDGDGDRVGLVDDLGRRVPSDQLVAWLAEQLVRRAGGGSVIYDLKLSRLVLQTVARAGGTAIAQKSGHTFIKTSMLQHDAVMGGEYSGHLFYRELEGGDDGLFSALLIGSLVADSGTPISEVIQRMPVFYSTPDIRIRYRGEKEPLIQQAAAHAEQAGARLVRVDGVKAEYPEGWALMRASVTEPAFTFRFEGKTRSDMLHVAERFLAGVGDLADAVLAQVHQHNGNEG